MKYHHAIRHQLEHDGYMVTMLRHEDIYTVAAANDGMTYIVQAENLTVAYLEVKKSIHRGLKERTRD